MVGIYNFFLSLWNISGNEMWWLTCCNKTEKPKNRKYNFITYTQMFYLNEFWFAYVYFYNDFLFFFENITLWCAQTHNICHNETDHSATNLLFPDWHFYWFHLRGRDLNRCFIHIITAFHCAHIFPFQNV